MMNVMMQSITSEYILFACVSLSVFFCIFLLQLCTDHQQYHMFLGVHLSGTFILWKIAVDLFMDFLILLLCTTPHHYIK